MKSQKPICPLCGSKKNKVLFENKVSLFKCRACGIIFNNTHRELKYSEEYFTSQYKEQYGKTYVEDFDNIYGASLARIKRIKKILKIKNNFGSFRKLLDIGSAMGFFLKAAKESGIDDVLGIEISSYASKYCKKSLKLNVINSSFMDADLNEKFNIISAWYFIEHSKDPVKAVSKIFELLSPGGIFAFSTPSFFGPQYFFKRSEWLKSHPTDHKIDFSPFTVKRFMKHNGFAEVYVFPAGIHPERIIPETSFFYKPVEKIYKAISRLVSFSDTIEVYAVKQM